MFFTLLLIIDAILPPDILGTALEHPQALPPFWVFLPDGFDFEVAFDLLDVFPLDDDAFFVIVAARVKANGTARARTSVNTLPPCWVFFIEQLMVAFTIKQEK